MELTQTPAWRNRMPTRKSPASAEKKTTTRKASTKKTVTAAAPVESVVVDPVAVDSAIARRTPTYEEIAVLAEQFWNERGRPFGSPEIDWLRAEATLHAA
jgi:hypothetical protein